MSSSPRKGFWVFEPPRKMVALIQALLTALILLVHSTGAYYGWDSTSFEFEEMLKKDLKVLGDLLSASEVQSVELATVRQATELAKRNANLRLSVVEQEYRNPISHFRLVDVMKETKKVTDLVYKLGIKDRVLLPLSSFPTKIDKLVVLQNLYKMQKSHGLRTKDLANGIISGSQGNKMEPGDCKEMAGIALSAGDEKLYVSWAKEALRRMSRDERYSPIGKSLQESVETVEDTIKCETLCTKKYEVRRTRKELKCSMWDGNRDPWLLLQPIKMEVIDTDPNIYRFYNVISDDEIEDLKALSWKKLNPAKTVGDTFQPVTLDSARVAHNYYPSQHHKLVARLDDRVSRITGLDLSLSDLLQVATYGIGGHYLPHYDALNDTFRIKRTATFMFYLSDIEMGGATVFVKPEIAILPQKGSALLWYNLLPSGYLDARTKHCACRVILGTKWIVNKWISAEGFRVCRKNEGLSSNDI